MMFSIFNCLCPLLQKSINPQTHLNWCLINDSRLMNKKGPEFVSLLQWSKYLRFKRLYSKIFSTSCANTHLGVTTFKVNGMMSNFTTNGILKHFSFSICNIFSTWFNRSLKCVYISIVSTSKMGINRHSKIMLIFYQFFSN